MTDTILISGMNGFVGSALRDRIEGLGSVCHKSKVTFLTQNMVPGRASNSCQNYQTYELSYFLNNLNSFPQYDAYIHAMSAPRSFGSERGKENLRLLEISLKFCKILNIKKYVFLSSGAVYEQSLTPKNEDDPLCSIKSNCGDYAHTKILAERFVRKFCEANDISYKILRLFSFGGKNLRGRLEFALPEFVDSAVKFGEIHVKEPKLIRSYMHEQDLARVIFDIASSRDSQSHIFNVGSGEQISLRELAFSISRIIGAIDIKIDKRSQNYPPKNVYVPNITRLHRLCNYDFKSIDEILQDMIFADGALNGC